MAPILSLGKTSDQLWASGPDGLFYIEDGDPDSAIQIPQPHEYLYCSAVCGDEIVVGGLPHILTLSTDRGANWQAAYVDEVNQAAMCIAPDRQYIQTGIILAGTEGAGILRSTDRGWRWTLCNFGLENFTVFTLAWAPTMSTWPGWSIVFAGTEDGLYRSPNSGLGWQRCTGLEGAIQCIAVSEAFHSDGTVLAGTDGQGLWRSCDGGRVFEPVGMVQQINAIAMTESGWLLSTDQCLYASQDSLNWWEIQSSPPALTLFPDGNTVWIGTAESLEKYALSTLFER